MAQVQTTSADTTAEPRRRVRRIDVLRVSDRTTLLVIAIASIITFITGWVSAPESPRFGQASAQAVRDWAMQNAGALRGYATMAVIAAVGFLVIAAGLSALVRRHTRGSMLPELLMAGVVGYVIITLLDVAAGTIGVLLPRLIDTSLPEVQDPIVRSWLAIAGYTHFLGDLRMVFVGTAIVVGALMALRLRLTNRWLCYVGLFVGACAFVGIFGITLDIPALYTFWFVGMFGLYLALAVLATSAFLTRRRIRLATVSAATAEAVVQ